MFRNKKNRPAPPQPHAPTNGSAYSRSYGPQAVRPAPTQPSISGSRSIRFEDPPAARTGQPSAPTPASASTPAKPTPMSWAQTATRGNAHAERPRVRIYGNWFCKIPKDEYEENLIKSIATDIARKYDCDYIGIRAGIHNTKTVRDPKTKIESHPWAPYHFTVEFRRRQNGKWMAAHVYTDTEKVKVCGVVRQITKGISKEGKQELAVEGIDENPQIFREVKPGRKGNPDDDTAFVTWL